MKYTDVVKMMKTATWLGRQINNVFGHDTMVGRTFGESNDTAMRNFYNKQLGADTIARQKQQAAEYDARQAQLQNRVNAQIDQRVIAMQKRDQAAKQQQLAQQQAKQRAQNKYIDQVAAQRGVQLNASQKGAIRSNAQQQMVAQKKPATPVVRATPPPTAQTTVPVSGTMRGKNVTNTKPRPTRQGYRTPDGVWHSI